jgi:fructose-bisphosphate aldolase, class I
MDTTARALVAAGKGVLAADESLPTIEKRFNSINVPSTEENRQAYRELLFATPGLGEFISGVRQKSADGTPLVEVLRRQGIIPGIKVDKGAKALAGSAGEKVTEGLDALRDRLAEYVQLGARFTKWRAVITIGESIPSRTCLEANAHALARFAALSQEAGLVPIVEPEVLIDGEHTIERHFEVTEATQRAVFHALAGHRVRLEAMLLKPNMVLAGKDCPRQADVAQVAEMTLCCLRRAVPAAVPGVVFLSGGQSDVQATKHLNALNQSGQAPWELSFSFGRALQAPALKAWGGKPENVAAAQSALHHRAGCNGSARHGKYSPEAEAHATRRGDILHHHEDEARRTKGP